MFVLMRELNEVVDGADLWYIEWEVAHVFDVICSSWLHKNLKKMETYAKVTEECNGEPNGVVMSEATAEDFATAPKAKGR